LRSYNFFKISEDLSRPNTCWGHTKFLNFLKSIE
jgi:hypothetical protein